MDYDIFISYRRVGGAQYARILKAELEKRGYRDRVFLDYDELKDGRFDNRIKSAIESAPVFIFILSPGSLDRCKNENDWVRQEIIHAIEHERHIIPVNFDGLFKDFPPTVPEQVREALGQHQFTKIDSETLLNASVEMLVNDRIAPIIAPRESTSKQEVGAEIAILSDADCDVLRFRKRLAVAHVDTETFVHLVKGNHLLEFVSKEYPEIKDTLKYNVPDNDYSDFIEVNLKSRVEEKRLESLRLIAVKDASGKWGFVDTSGNVVIPFIYDDAGPFREGLAGVEDASGKWGYIDKTGKIVISCIYEDAYDFSDGLACVMDGLYGLIDKTGKVIISCCYWNVGAIGDGLISIDDGSDKWGYIDKTGEVVIPCIYNDARGFREGLACVEDTSGKRGYIDKTGEVVVPCSYNYASDFSEDLACVEDYSCKSGYIDKTGKVVIPCIYEDAWNFHDGLARVKDSFGKWGYIDKTGKVVVPCIYKNARDFSEGLACVQDTSGTWGYIDETGKVVIPCVYDYAGDFCEGLACVQDSSGKWGVINKNGDVVIPCIYEGIIL